LIMRGIGIVEVSLDILISEEGKRLLLTSCVCKRAAFSLLTLNLEFWTSLFPFYGNKEIEVFYTILLYATETCFIYNMLQQRMKICVVRHQ
jgi:hypothetical protein